MHENGKHSCVVYFWVPLGAFLKWSCFTLALCFAQSVSFHSCCFLCLSRCLSCHPLVLFLHRSIGIKFFLTVFSYGLASHKYSKCYTIRWFLSIKQYLLVSLRVLGASSSAHVCLFRFYFSRPYVTSVIYIHYKTQAVAETHRKKNHHNNPTPLTFDWQ